MHGFSSIWKSVKSLFWGLKWQIPFSGPTIFNLYIMLESSNWSQSIILFFAPFKFDAFQSFKNLMLWAGDFGRNKETGMVHALSVKLRGGGYYGHPPAPLIFMAIDDVIHSRQPKMEVTSAGRVFFFLTRRVESKLLIYAYVHEYIYLGLLYYLCILHKN